MRHKKCPACGADMLFGDAMPWGWPERSQVDLRTKLSSLAVHRRFLKALDTAGVRTVGDCYERGTRGLLMIDNFGRKGLNQIGAALMPHRGKE